LSNWPRPAGSSCGCCAATCPNRCAWLAATGNSIEADRVLTEIERQVGASAPPVVEVIEPATQGPVAMTTSGVSGSYRRRSVLLWVMWILGPIGFYGFASIAPIRVPGQGLRRGHIR
jgi:putative MFS transporter